MAQLSSVEHAQTAKHEDSEQTIRSIDAWNETCKKLQDKSAVAVALPTPTDGTTGAMIRMKEQKKPSDEPDYSDAA